MTAQDAVRIAARLCSARSLVTVDAGAHMFPATLAVAGRRSRTVS